MSATPFDGFGMRVFTARLPPWDRVLLGFRGSLADVPFRFHVYPTRGIQLLLRYSWFRSRRRQCERNGRNHQSSPGAGQPSGRTGCWAARIFLRETLSSQDGIVFGPVIRLDRLAFPPSPLILFDPWKGDVAPTLLDWTPRYFFKSTARTGKSHGPRTGPARSGSSSREISRSSIPPRALPRAADGDRPRSGLEGPRSAAVWMVFFTFDNAS